MQIRLHPRHQERKRTGCQQLTAQFCRFLKLRYYAGVFFYFFNLLICKTIFDMLYYKSIRSGF